MEIRWLFVGSTSNPRKLQSCVGRALLATCKKRHGIDVLKDKRRLNNHAQNTFSRLLVVVLLKEVPKNKFIYSDLNKNRHSCCSRVACALDIANGMVHVVCHLIWKAPLSSRFENIPTSQHYVKISYARSNRSFLFHFKTIKFSTFLWSL